MKTPARLRKVQLEIMRILGRRRRATARLRTTVVLGAAFVVALALTLVSATAALPAAPGAPSVENPRVGSTTAVGERHRPVLEQVRELDKPVTYTETKIPLGELIQKVAADTGAPLTAATGVADEPV